MAAYPFPGAAMPAESTAPTSYLDRLKLWAFYAAATLAITLVSALAQRFVGAPVPVTPPPPPPAPVTVVIEQPGGADPLVRVFHGASP